jgi:hypothetical protein
VSLGSSRCRFECGRRRWRLRSRRRLRNYWLLFARNWSHRWLDGASRRWRNHNHRTRNRDRARRWLSHDSAGRRTAGNGWRSSGLRNNRRGLPRLWNNHARLRARQSCRSNRRRNGRGPGRLRGRSGRFCRHAHVARLIFLFLLLGQNGLQHIAGLRDVRQINFGSDGRRAVVARRTCAVRRRPRFPIKMRTNPIRLVAFERT